MTFSESAASAALAAQERSMSAIYSQIKYRVASSGLTATQLGNLAGISGLAMNKLLAVKGLQEKSKLGNWVPTDKGMRYCELIDIGMKTPYGNPIKKLTWFPDVLEAIQPRLFSEGAA